VKQLKNIDICECPFIEDSGFIKCLEENASTLKRIQASNSQLAVTDETLKAFNNLPDL
jgi:hypothetical protein